MGAQVPAELELQLLPGAVPLNANITARPGFAFGQTVRFDSSADPPIVGGLATADPAAWPARGTFSGALLLASLANDFDAAGGPGFGNAFNSSGRVALASGATDSDLEVSVALDTSIAFGGLRITDPADSAIEYVVCVVVTPDRVPPGCTDAATLPFLTIVELPEPCFPADEVGTSGLAPCDGLSGAGGGAVRFDLNGPFDAIDFDIISIPLQFDDMGNAFDDPNDATDRDITSTVDVQGSVTVSRGARLRSSCARGSLLACAD